MAAAFTLSRYFSLYRGPAQSLIAGFTVLYIALLAKERVGWMKEKSKAEWWKKKQEEEKKNSHKFVHPAHAFTSVRRSSQFPYDWSFSGFYSLGSPRLALSFFFIRNAPNVFPRIVLLQLESLTLFLFSRFSAYRVSCFTRRDCQDGSVEPATEDTKIASIEGTISLTRWIDLDDD